MRRSFISERIAQLILILMVIALPWRFGGVEAGVQAWCFAALSLPLGLWCLDLFLSKKNLPSLPKAILIPVLAFGLGVIQLIPFSTDIIQKVSPKTLELREELSASPGNDDLTNNKTEASAKNSEKSTFSLNPYSTRNTLVLLGLGVVSFSLGARFFNESTATIALFTMLAINGAAFSLYAIVQYLQWNGMIYWSIPIPEGSGPFGSFINRNNAGGYLNLCLGGAIGMVIWRLSQIGYIGGNQPDSPVIMYSEDRALGEDLRSYLSQINLVTVISFVFSVFIIAGVFCSRSRGACVSMGIGMIVVFIMLLKTRRNQFPLILLGIPLLAGVLLVGWVGMTNDIHKRYSLLFNKETIMNTRLPNWMDGIQALPDYTVMGTGLGTYRDIYPMYQNRFDEDWYYHAENEYLESIVELGLPGLALIVLMVLILVSNSTWLTGVSYEPRFYGVAIASLFIVTSQLIHFLFDFGLHIPSNLILFSLIAGSISGTASIEASTGSVRSHFSLPRSKIINVGFAVTLLAACYYGYFFKMEASGAELAIRKASLSKPQYDHSPDEWAEVISGLKKAVEINPESAELHQSLGYAYINKYRSEAYQVLISQVSKEKELTDAIKAVVWKNSSATVLHARLYQLKNAGKAEELEQLKKDKIVVQNLYPAIESFQDAIGKCPLLGSSHLYLAKLSPLQPGKLNESRQLEIAELCSPSDPDTYFQLGLMHYAAGRNSLAMEKWQKSLSLTGRHLKSIRKMSDRRFSKVDFVEKILPSTADMIVKLVMTEFNEPEEIGTRFLLIDKVNKILKANEYPESERCYYQAVILGIQGEYDDAEENYSRAVKLRPEKVQWRYEFALLLKDVGKLSEAFDHARRCVWLKSNDKKYKNLLEEITQLQEQKKSDKKKLSLKE